MARLFNRRALVVDAGLMVEEGGGAWAGDGMVVSLVGWLVVTWSRV